MLNDKFKTELLSRKKMKNAAFLLLIVLMLTGNYSTTNGQKKKITSVNTRNPSQSTKQTSDRNPNDIPGYYWQRSECLDVRVGYDALLNLLNIKELWTDANARRFATQIKTGFPNWYVYLPCCPEKLSDANSTYWEVSNTAISCFHTGAENCIRSKSKFNSARFAENELATGHGQQCCYDKLGNLIREGVGAGTPDFASATSPTENGKHQLLDVLPWIFTSLNENHSIWKPNQGCRSGYRLLVSSEFDWHSASMYVKRGEVITFLDAKGEVRWGAKGSTSGPEGSNIIAESDIGFALAPPKLRNARTGSLIGLIYNGKYNGGNDTIYPDATDTIFPIGKGQTFIAPQSGHLFLGVNDGYPQNNSGYFDVAIRKDR